MAAIFLLICKKNDIEKQIQFYDFLKIASKWLVTHIMSLSTPVEVGSLSHNLQGSLHLRCFFPDFWKINSIKMVCLNSLKLNSNFTPLGEPERFMLSYDSRKKVEALKYVTKPIMSDVIHGAVKKMMVMMKMKRSNSEK